MLFDYAFFWTNLIATCSIAHTLGYNTIVDFKYCKIFANFSSSLSSSICKSNMFYDTAWTRAE
jgi:hypothetical protein